MDGRLFDDLLRDFSNSRRTLLGTALTAAGAITGVASSDAKKKKKPCKKKCKDGCCTSKKGKCIKPAQQSSTQCGTGGEICRSTNCGGGGEQCAETCEGCCAGDSCVMTDSQTQCGRNGVDCFPCDDNQECAGTYCCGKPGHACASAGECCLTLDCEDDKCCAHFSACTKSADCCQLGAEVICDNNQCVIPTGDSCQPGWMCEGNLPCPGSGICGDPGDCTVPCQDFGMCSPNVCFGNLYCCTPDSTSECNVPEFFCNCIVEGGGECTNPN